MTNSLTVVAKIFLNTLIFLLQKCESIYAKATYFFFSKKFNVFVIFQDRNFNVTLANNFFRF